MNDDAFDDSSNDAKTLSDGEKRYGNCSKFGEEWNRGDTVNIY